MSPTPEVIQVVVRQQVVKTGPGWCVYRIPTEVPPGYVVVDRRAVFLLADGVLGEEPVDPRVPAEYLGHVVTLSRSRSTPVPAVVATWQSSEDAEPDPLS